MFIIQTKRHGAKDDIQALNQNMIMGANFRNILLIYLNLLPFCRFCQA